MCIWLHCQLVGLWQHPSHLLPLLRESSVTESIDGNQSFGFCVQEAITTFTPLIYSTREEKTKITKMILVSNASGILLFLVLISLCCCYVNTAGVEAKSSGPTSTDKRQFVDCKYPGGTTPGGSKPEVYWINLNSSVLRRKAMTSFLNDFGYPHFRVEGLTRKDLYVPDDMIAGWGFRCNHKTTFTPRAVKNFDNTLDQLFPRKIFIKGLCGSVENNKKELVVIVSHLLAIRNAVYSTTATSRYALILEDDVWSPFDINFELMATELQTEMGRPFGIIQFFNSKARTIDEVSQSFYYNTLYNRHSSSWYRIQHALMNFYLRLFVCIC